MPEYLRGGDIMRFNDVQDTRRAEVRQQQRNAGTQDMGLQFMESLSSVTMHKQRTIVAFGATFTI